MARSDTGQSEDTDLSVLRMSFDVFYETRWTDIYRPVAVTLRDADLAAEATDEAMVRAFQRWNKVRAMTNPEGWVYRVAVNYGRSWYRRARRQRRLFPTATYDESWFEPGLEQAFSRLSLEHRQVIVMRYLLDWSEREIAEALKVPPGTVKSRLHRAVGELRSELT